MQAPVRSTPANAILQREAIGPIAVLTLNRPQARNSLSEDLLAALSAELAAIAGDRTVRAVVLAANGPAFCAGHDMRELLARRTDPDGGRAYFAQLMDQCCAVMLAIVRLPQPVIAAVQGAATAAGCQLVATCDLAVASAGAGFCTPGVNIGLFCSTRWWRSRATSRASTRWRCCSPATRFRPTRPSASAWSTGWWRAGRSARKRSRREEDRKQVSPTVKLGKEAFYAQSEMNLADAYRYASRVMAENMMMHDAAEGIGAFLEKRNPAWEDR
jgi:enoyl-CoA hydratase/carnithine racemase